MLSAFDENEELSCKVRVREWEKAKNFAPEVDNLLREESSFVRWKLVL